jgi:hypothetical protein
MHDLRDLHRLDPKSAAKRLRTALKEKRIDLSHGECLDLVARQLGLKDWNVLAAELDRSPDPATAIEVPAGWLLDGENTGSFVGGLDPQQTYLGQPVFWLRNAKGEGGFATLMQVVAGEHYGGRRVRFSGHLRADGVAGHATIWLRADDARGRLLAFNNLVKLPTNGAVKGTTGWARREIVMDVPEETVSVNFGFYLHGLGEARYSAFDLQIVGTDVAVTKIQESDAPVNLDFAISRS